ncbi:MAG: T9SS type A sorting domain-containing protein [Cytophagaceae bacterium]
MKQRLLLFNLIMFLGFIAYGQNLQISGGNNFSAAVCDNQTVFVWGSNVSGQLGLTAAGAPVAVTYRNTAAAVTQGNISNVAGGSTIGALPAIRQIDAGSGAHILGLSCAKQVWAWGDNTKGQLGRNTNTNSAVPQRVLRGEQAANVNANDPNGIFLNNIFYVSGGNNCSFALEEGTGRVLAWGENDNGQLGDNSVIERWVPRYVRKSDGTLLTNIVQIEGGDACAYALDRDGYVWSWGLNTGNQLGRPGASPQMTAGMVVKGDPLNSGYSATPAPTQYLTGITMISGGDTHCLALEGATGHVWSFGGDWGQGQLGRGGGDVYQNDARRVVRPGLTAYATVEADFLGNGVDGKAIYVSAGQASSAVVMENGKVVTFGARGLFNGGATDQASGVTITCPALGDMISSGTLGDANAACNSGTCDGKATQWSRTPRYVKSNAAGTTDLSGIKSISDGDAWYYAVSSTGQAYVWGWNRRGELGLGDYTDRCFAVPFTLPSGCNFSDPCPGQPRLGADYSSCPVFSTTLNSQITQDYSTWRHTWEYRALGATGAWTTVTGPGNFPTQAVNQLGQWRISLSDTRATVPFLCGPCPVLRDTIVISETPNPYTVAACADNTASLAQFSVTAPVGSQIKWYTNQSGGSALNPSNTNPTITTAFTNTNTTIPGCSRALFAEDISSKQSTLLPATTTAQLATVLGASGEACASGNWQADWDNNATPRTFLQITVTQEVRITAASLLTGAAGNSNFSIKIYNNNASGGPYCGTCTPAGNKDAPGTLRYTATYPTAGTVAVTDNQIIEVPTNHTLPAGTYWIGVAGSGVQVRHFNCNKATTSTGAAPIWNNPFTEAEGIMRGTLGMRDNNLGTRGSVFNIKFETGSGYTCGRILVCVSSACVLPVTLLNFDATKRANVVDVNWTTSAEEGSSYFVIQRSSDGNSWENIGTVKAAGNTNRITEYSFIDEKPLGGVSYYRYVQYDLNGQSEEGPIASVEFNDLGFQIIPNPNSGVFNLLIDGEEKDAYYVDIVNSIGQSMYTKTFNTDSGNVNTQISLDAAPAGVYYVIVKTSGKQLVKKMVKE